MSVAQARIHRVPVVLVYTVHKLTHTRQNSTLRDVWLDERVHPVITCLWSQCLTEVKAGGGRASSNGSAMRPSLADPQRSAGPPMTVSMVSGTRCKSSSSTGLDNVSGCGQDDRLHGMHASQSGMRSRAARTRPRPRSRPLVFEVTAKAEASDYKNK